MHRRVRGGQPFISQRTSDMRTSSCVTHLDTERTGAITTPRKQVNKLMRHTSGHRAHRGDNNPVQASNQGNLQFNFLILKSSINSLALLSVLALMRTGRRFDISEKTASFSPTSLQGPTRGSKELFLCLVWEFLSLSALHSIKPQHSAVPTS
jgi:hypothetical protein